MTKYFDQNTCGGSTGHTSKQNLGLKKGFPRELKITPKMRFSKTKPARFESPSDELNANKEVDPFLAARQMITESN